MRVNIEYVNTGSSWPPVSELSLELRECELEYWERKYSSKFAPPRVLARMDALMESE